ncbi:MAG: type II secretion system protein GspM [Pseudomonadota bacterium]|nr:type II secretion system protein GspM [Pseudomonadota bacterium]
MTLKEKRLLQLAAVVFVVLLSVQLLPAALRFVQNYWQQLELYQRDIENAKKLQQQTQYWQQQHAQAQQQHQAVYNSLLLGANPQLVGANLQKLLRTIAHTAGITISSMDPPETEISRNQEWMLVVQTIRFDATSKTLIAFLQALDQAQEKLVVSNLNIRARRDKLDGTMKITGFAQAP